MHVHGVFSLDGAIREEAGECGYRSLVVALGALPGTRPEVLSYEGPFGVGYMVARFVPDPLSSGIQEYSFLSSMFLFLHFRQPG